MLIIVAKSKSSALSYIFDRNLELLHIAPTFNLSIIHERYLDRKHATSSTRRDCFCNIWLSLLIPCHHCCCHPTSGVGFFSVSYFFLTLIPKQSSGTVFDNRSTVGTFIEFRAVIWISEMSVMRANKWLSI